MSKSPLTKESRIYIAGHRGMVGSAIRRHLQSEGYKNNITRTHAELDLTNQQAVRAFFQSESIEYIVLAAAKVGGIMANNTHRAEFIYQNLMIQNNVIHEAYKAGIQRLLFLGSSCIYPRHAPQPMKEEYLLTGPLEPTNEPYAIAKIAGIKMCESYNRQYGTKYRSVMPTNLYGPNDNYDLETSHLMAALIRKIHLAKLAQQGDWEGIQKDQSKYGQIPEDVLANLAAISQDAGHSLTEPFISILSSDFCSPSSGEQTPIVLWGTGSPLREFIHVDDMAEACVFIMNLSDNEYEKGLASIELSEFDFVHSTMFLVPCFYNLGIGEDFSIKQYANMVAQVVGYNGLIDFDVSKPDGMPQKLLDVTRLNNLGWQAKISIYEGIKRTYKFYVSEDEKKISSRYYI